MFFRFLRMGCCSIALLFCGALLGVEPKSIFISDTPELILSAAQNWGELGLNAAAHAAGIAPMPLRIGEKNFGKGLGHHANGEIVLLLDGNYASFDAQVGIQSQSSSQGSVIFRVFADGKLQFDSGVMHQADGAKPVHVPTEGVEELRLEASDAGDGIACDMANWADARLTQSKNFVAKKTKANEEAVDVAKFARVVSWYPNRDDGSRASRIEEYRAEDLFLESELVPDEKGTYRTPISTNQLACIGLQWLNRRAIKELQIEFTDGRYVPATNNVQVQGWFGESAWQGSWKPLHGAFETEAAALSFKISAPSGGLGMTQVQKVRWIIPSSRPLEVRRLSAFTRSRWQTIALRIEAEKPLRYHDGELRVVNGTLIGGVTNYIHFTSQPILLQVRYSAPSLLKSDPTVLQFKLPSGSFGVAMEDLLTDECVYLREHGLFLARASAGTTLAAYKKEIAGRTTVLQRVRALPDQTLAQAMSRTHHDVQRNGPVLLSLSCDNSKFVVEREGAVQFQARAIAQAGDWMQSASVMQVKFGDGANGKLTRQLDGGWLPIPVITVENKNVTYRERVFVAPIDEPGSNPARLNRPSICVAEFTLDNKTTSVAVAELALTFTSTAKEHSPLQFRKAAQGVWLVSGTNMVAFVSTALTSLENRANSIVLSQKLSPRSTTKCVVYFLNGNAPSPKWTAADLRKKTEEYWNCVLSSATQIETPDPFINNLIRSSQVRCLIAARNEENGQRIAPWIGAMTYGPLESESHSIIRGMDLLGHDEFARRSLDFFVHRYNTNGFLTTGYTTFGTAWHLWTLGEHYQRHADREWLKSVAPQIARVGEWIVRQAEKTKRVNARGEKVPEFGLMPPGVLADWNAFAFHYCMSAYYCAALREIGTALHDIGDPRGEKFLTAAAELRENLLRAYHWTQSQSPALPLRDGTWICSYPSQVHSPGKLADFFPGQDGGRSWCYDVELGAHQLVPTGVLDVNGPETTQMLEHMEDVQFLSEGWFDYPADANEKDWFDLGGFSKVQPYYTRNAEIYALRNDPKPFVRSYFNTLAAMVNPEVMTFWEHFHNTGAWDKTHETGYFLQQSRFMLVMEHGKNLWLAPLITSNWLRDGNVIEVKNAPTRFGKVGFRMISHVKDGYIVAQIDPPTRYAPESIVLPLRHPEGKRILSVTIDGRRFSLFDQAAQAVVLKPNGVRMVVQVNY